MNFNDRLKLFREQKGFTSKKDFAETLGVNENSYYMFEKGTRKPSKRFIQSLVCYSNLPEEYWLYGLTLNSELCEVRPELKMISLLMDEFKDKYIETNKISESQKELITMAFEADLKHLIAKEKSKEQD